MKKEYNAPEAEIVEFEISTVFTISNPGIEEGENEFEF